MAIAEATTPHDREIVMIYAVFSSSGGSFNDQQELVIEYQNLCGFIEAATPESAVADWNKEKTQEVGRAEPARIIEAAGLSPAEAIDKIAETTGSNRWAANVEDVRRHLTGNANYWRSQETSLGRQYDDQGDNFLVRGYALHQRVYIDPEEFPLAPSHRGMGRVGPFDIDDDGR